MTAIYRVRAMIPEFVPQTLAAAYAAAGIDRPAPPQQLIETAIRELPGAAAVGRAIVTAAHDDPQQAPGKFATDARRRMAEALAADALRDAWGRHARGSALARQPRDTDQAAQDLAPAFAEAVDALRAAAAELDPRATPAASGTPHPSGQPTPGPVSLDPEAAIARDAGGALTTARRELARLAMFAGITAAGPLSNAAASGLATLVPVLAIDGAAVEVCIRSAGESITTTNAAKLGTTRAVRRLAADAKADIDAAILGVVRGHYEGVSLRLNNAQQAQHTRQQITAAFGREWVDNPNPQRGRPFVAVI